MKRQKQEKAISDELIDGWLAEGRKPEDVHALLKQITKAVVERAMQRRPPRWETNRAS